MNKNLLSWVGWLLLLSITAFYLYYIGEAIYFSLHNKGENAGNYKDVLATAMGSVQALLVTNLGVLLGIAIKNPNSAVARSLQMGAPDAAAMAPPSPATLKESIQLAALLIYVLSLIACVVTWALRSFEVGSTIVPLIPESGKMFIGICIAYLTAILK